MHRFQSWRDALQIAPDPTTIRGIVRDYVAALGPLVDTIPPACQRELRVDEIDIQTAAVTLLHAELSYRGTDEVRDLLHEIAHTFAAASVRISILHGRVSIPAG